MFGFRKRAKGEFDGLILDPSDCRGGTLGSPPTENGAFSGHHFQDIAAKKKDGWLVQAFAPLLDCQMAQHKLDTEIHLQRVAELREIEQRIKAT